MGELEPTHLVLLLLVVLVVFGGRRLPELGRSLGTGMRAFKDGLSGDATPDPAAVERRGDEPARR